MSERKLTTYERRILHGRVFNEVIEMYTSLVQNNGASTTPRGVTKGSRVVAPSTCDFICDVELTAARVLSKKEYTIFIDVFKDASKEEKDVPAELLDHIKNRVGKLLLSRHIYPTTSYFRGKEIN